MVQWSIIACLYYAQKTTWRILKRKQAEAARCVRFFTLIFNVFLITFCGSKDTWVTWLVPASDIRLCILREMVRLLHLYHGIEHYKLKQRSEIKQRQQWLMYERCPLNHWGSNKGINSAANIKICTVRWIFEPCSVAHL